MRYVSGEEIRAQRLTKQEPLRPVIEEPVMFVLESAWRHWRLILSCILVSGLLGIVYIVTAKPVYTGKTTVTLDTQRAAPYAGQSNGAETLFMESQLEELRSDKSLLGVIEKLKLWDVAEFQKKDRSSLKLLVSYLKMSLVGSVDAPSEDQIMVAPGEKVGPSVTSDLVGSVDAPSEDQIMVAPGEKVGPSVTSDLVGSVDAPSEDQIMVAPGEEVDPSATSDLVGSVDVPAENQNMNAKGEEQDSPANRMRILYNLRKSLKVERVGKSYIAEIYFNNHNPVLSAQLANALADVYLANRVQELENSGTWIQKRTEEIGSRMQTALRAVETFKLENNVVLDDDGKLTGERELEALSSMRDVITAEAQGMESRLQLMTAMLKHPADGDPDGMRKLLEAASLRNSELAELKQEFETASQAFLIPKVSKTGINSVPDKETLKLIRLHEEIRAAVQKYIGEYRRATEATKERRMRIEKRFSDVFEQTNAARQMLAKLRELETQAEILKTLYSSYLSRQMQNLEQTVFPVSQARIMSRAVTPVEPAWPKPTVVLLLSTLTGALFGFGAGVVSDYRGPALITERSTLEPLLGSLPISSIPFLGHLAGLEEPTSYQTVGTRLGEKKAQERAKEALLSISLALGGKEFGQKCTLAVGIFSTRTGQGASCFAYNLAKFAAEGSARTLLIDADCHNRTLTKGLSPGEAPNLAEALTDASNIEQYVTAIDDNFDFIGAPADTTFDFPARMVCSKEMLALLESAKKDYKYIFLDLPSVLEYPDARFSVRAIDKFILNLEHAKTTLEDVADCIRELQASPEHIIRAIINKTPTKKTFFNRLA